MPPPFGAKTTADEAVQHFAPQIKGKVILITGVSPNSLGACFVQAIAKAQPKLLILAGRNAAKAEETARSIDSGGNGVSTRVLTLDLSSQQQVRDAAATVNNYEESIDVLVNNAGIMASDYFTTVDGIEGQFGTNHIGPWLFTNLVIGKILSSPGGGRVVNVSSNGYRLSGVRFHDYNFHGGETYNKWRSYGQAKTANMLTALALAEKLSSRGLVAVSLHPGAIKTNLSLHLDWSKEFAELTTVDKQNGNAEGWWTSLTYKTQSEGIATHVFACFEPSLKDANGRYLEDCAVMDDDALYGHGNNPRDAKKLWALSEALTGQVFQY